MGQGIPTKAARNNLAEETEKQMTNQEHINYERIARAIRFIRENRHRQPRLEEVAAAVNMSPYHFQRTFREWAGVTPKHFLQFLNVEYAKRILTETRAPLLDAAYATGLSSAGRLHDLFVSVEGMTPGEYKNGGEHLSINYSFSETPFGDIIIASTPKGVCSLEFLCDGAAPGGRMVAPDRTAALGVIRHRFPNATFREAADDIQRSALAPFAQDWNTPAAIKLHLKGTPFQLKVWEALLRIPMGAMATYSTVSAGIGHPKACRTVGTAVGDNPVAFLIPCHRVIKSTGDFGNYHWGAERKSAILGWEAAKTAL